MFYQSFSHFIIAFALSSMRLTGAFLLCPALTDSMILGTARRVAILGFSVLLVPYVMRTMPPGELSLSLLLVISLKEVLIGVLLGFFSAIPFWVAENVGNFIDNQRGATMGEVYSPLSGSQVSTTGILFTQIVSTLFFVTGAFLLLLSALYKSYSLWPMFGHLSFQPGAPIAMLGTLDTMLKDTVVISAPIIIIMFLATLGLGFVNRTAPQLNVFFLSMPIKSGLGMAMLVIYLPFILDMLMYTRDTDLLGPMMKLLQ